MNRRAALSTMSGLAAGSLLLAGGVAQAQQTATQPAPTGSVVGEKAYTTQTLTIGTMSKQASQLALTNAAHPKIREFAQFEVAEQTTIAQALTRTANPPPMPLPQPLAAKLAQLQATSGKAFDAAYIQGQIEGHQQLFNIQQEFLNGVPHDPDHEHIAMLARTVIQMHLVMLADLQQTLSAA